jgi:FSR family fosmidomycin resistance protein-like MFS transporter
MIFTLSGILLLAFATSYLLILIAVSLVGVGSSVFHPEASRIARLSSGGRHGMAQSLFQVGGNIGSAIGPLLAALILAARGQHGLAWFAVIALGGVALLGRVSFWYRRHERRPKPSASIAQAPLPRPVVLRAILILSLLMFSKFFYMSAMTSFYTFFLIGKFAVSVQQSQLMLFVFLASVAIGTMAGGPIGDRVGRKPVLWASIIGALPFTLALPHLGYSATIVSSIFIGLTLSSAFPAIVVYAQELVPGKVGVISGIFFGLAFGLGGIGAALLGWLADATSIEFVFNVCGVLPVIGGMIWFLPGTKAPASEAISATGRQRAD